MKNRVIPIVPPNERVKLNGGNLKPFSFWDIFKSKENSGFSIRMCPNCGIESKMHFTDTWCSHCNN